MHARSIAIRALRRVARVAAAARRRAYISETHVWYRLPFDAGPPPAPPDGYTIRRGGREDVRALAEAGLVNASAASAHLAAGARLWVAAAGAELVYMVWTFRGGVPAVAARGGQLALPARFACLENAYAVPAHRHFGLGRCVVRHAMAVHRDEGDTEMIARIAEGNGASRGSVAKLGAQEVARVRFRRLGPWRSVRVEPRGDGRIAAALARALRHEPLSAEVTRG